MKNMKNHKNNIISKKKAISCKRDDINAMIGGEFIKNRDNYDKIISIVDDLLLMIQENKKMITVGPWLTKHHIYKSHAHFWSEKYPEFKNRYKAAKEMLADRILYKSFYREGDPGTGRFMLPHLDDDYMRLEEWKANLKQQPEEKKGPTIINVYQTEFKESGKVPDRKSDVK